MTVYFIRAVGGIGPIKIGESDDDISRVEFFSLWSPFPLEVLATIPGGAREEHALHALFADARLHGEWFEAVPPLLALVERAKAHVGPATMSEGDVREAAFGGAGRGPLRQPPTVRRYGPGARMMKAWYAAGLPLSTQLLAERAQVSLAECSRLRRGQVGDVPRTTAERLAGVLGCSLEWLHSGQGPMYPVPLTFGTAERNLVARRNILADFAVGGVGVLGRVMFLAVLASEGAPVSRDLAIVAVSIALPGITHHSAQCEVQHACRRRTTPVVFDYRSKKFALSRTSGAEFSEVTSALIRVAGAALAEARERAGRAEVQTASTRRPGATRAA